MIVSSPEILGQLGIDAAVIDNVLVIRGHGCRETVSTRRFHYFTFPGVSSFEARLITQGEGEIIINNSIIVPILSASAEKVAPHHEQVATITIPPSAYAPSRSASSPLEGIGVYIELIGPRSYWVPPAGPEHYTQTNKHRGSDDAGMSLTS